MKVRGLAANDPETFVIAHAPILYARADTIGRFSDAPLVMWYERLPQSGGGEVVQYSVIFTNEDGGTASDALMARWGRGTDIEYVYRLGLDAQGNVRDEIYQAPDHKDVPFRGKRIGTHPLFLDATLNNTFMDAGETRVQYHVLPQRMDLAQHSREWVMDQNPWTYRVMSQELQREGKISEASRGGNQMADPRHYLYLDAASELTGTALSFAIKLKEIRFYP